MPVQVLSDVAASISELKANPMKVVSSGDGFPVAVLNRNQPVFYCVPSAAYEALLDMVDDVELRKLIKERQDEPTLTVTLDEL